MTVGRKTRYWRVLKDGDTLYIGPDIALKVQRHDTPPLHLRIISSRHLRVIHESGDKGRVLPAQAHNHVAVERGDKIQIGPDVLLTRANEGSINMRLLIRADHSLHIHHQKAQAENA